MSQWWEDAPLADEPAGGDWWSAAPLADDARRELPAGVTPSTAGAGRGSINPPMPANPEIPFGAYADPERTFSKRESVLETLPPEPDKFSFGAASRGTRKLDDRAQRERDFGTVAPIRGPEPSVESVARGLATDLVAGGKNARAGISQMTADLTGSQYQARQARKERGQADLMTAVNTPEFESDTARGIYSGLSSTVRQAPAIAAALVTRNPAVALGGMVAPMVPDEYGKFRARGASPGEALPAAAAMAATEYITEKLPMGLLVKQFGKVGAGKLLTGMLAREVPGEQVATLVQDAIDTAVANPDKTWSSYLAERPGAAYQTLLATITQTGLMTGASALAGSVNRTAEDAPPNAEQVARARGFLNDGERITAPKVEDQPTVPVVPSARAAPAVPVNASTTEAAGAGTNEQTAAVDNIARLLGTKAPDVSTPVAPAGQPAAGPGSRGADDAGSLQPGGRMDLGAGGSLPAAGAPASGLGQAVAVEDAGPAAGPVATLNDSGTLTIKGEPQSIIQMLRAGGVVSLLPATNGVLVGANQAEAALALVQGKSNVSNQGQPAAPSQAVPARPEAPAAKGGDAPARAADPAAGAAATVEADRVDAQPAAADNAGAAPVVSERLQSAHIGGVQAGAATSTPAGRATSGTAEPSLSDSPEKWAAKTTEYAKSIAPSAERVGQVADYSLLRDARPDWNQDDDGRILAVDKTGNVVADVFFGRRDDGKLEAAVEVAPVARRQGIASAIYDHIERSRGESLAPAAQQTSPARAFWEARQRQGTPAPEQPPAAAKPQPDGKVAANPFKTFLIRNGVALRLAKEFAPGTKERLAMSRTFRNGGLELDALAERAAEQGYIRDRMDTDELYDLIVKVASGQRVAPMYGQDAEAEMAALVDRQREMEEDAAEAVEALSDESREVLDDIPWDAPSNVSEAEAMRALGFTDQEIRDATAARQERAQEAGEGSRRPVEAAAGEAQADTGAGQGEAREEGLTAPTAADILAQQSQREAEQQRRDEGGDKPAAVRSPTRDQIDLLNPQGGIFDAPISPSPAKAEEALKGEGKGEPQETPSFKRDSETGSMSAWTLGVELAEALDSLTVPYKLHETVEAARQSMGIDLPDDSKGGYWRGTIHLFAERIANARDGELVLWHEANHAGIDALYRTGSKEYEQALRMISARNANVRARAKAWMVKWGEAWYEGEVAGGFTPERAMVRTKLQAVNEALSNLAGENAQINGLARFVASLQEILRSLGLNRLADWLEGKTQAEALSMILSARQAVTKPKAATAGMGEMQPAFSQDGDNEPMASRKDVVGNNEGGRSADDETEGAAVRSSRVRLVEEDYRLPNLANAVPKEYIPKEASQSTVKVYRAVPSDTKDATIRPGDWVSLSSKYAAIHGTGKTGRSKVISMDVPADHVAWAGTDMNEYFYVPRDSNESPAPDTGGAMFSRGDTTAPDADDPKGPAIGEAPPARTLAEGYAPSGRRTVSKTVSDVIPGFGLDPAGRIQLEVGERIKNFLAEKSGPWWERIGMKGASPALKHQLRQMKLDIAKAQDTAVAVARESQALSQPEREMVSDIIEQEAMAGTLPPQHAVRLAGIISATMETQTDELVRLGMLTKDTADRWRGKYLPRYYKSKLLPALPDAWSTALQGLRGKTSAMKGIKGKHLKGRGMYETAPVDQLSEYQAQGWEVRDAEYEAYLKEPELYDGAWEADVQIWRDYTRAEREKMGEIRDVGFRFVMGYMETQKDIALGRMFESMAGDPEMSSRQPKEGMDVQVPDTGVPGTGAKRYGKLAGRYVAKATMSHLSQIEEAQSDALRLYREALGLWKEGKTVLNPVSHMNNVVSNLTMAHLAGVSYHRGDKYLAAVLDFARGSPQLKEARDAGLFLGTVSDEELKNTLPKELRDLAVKQESYGRKAGRTAFNVLTFGLRRPLGWAYQNEDLFFRYLIWKDATERGMDSQEAVDYAQKFIFTYDDLPATARKIRDFGIPFFSYTYKFIPAALSVAATHPWRLAAPAGVLWAAQAAMYAMVADDDDEGWMDVLHRFLNDGEFRDKAAAKREAEAKNLPPWLKGRTALGTPRAMRLGTDETTQLPMFIDVSRMIPGGDIFDVSPNAGGVPFFQWATPSHPLFTTAVAMFGNKDMFRGKDLVDANDTKGEATEKRLDWLWKQLSPALAVNNLHWERMMNALAYANGGELPAWVPDVIGGDATGIGRDGLPVQPKHAALQTIGIKVRPMDLDKAEQIDGAMKNKTLREIDAEMRSMARQNRLGSIPDRVYEKARDLSAEKKSRIREGLTVDGDEKP